MVKGRRSKISSVTYENLRNSWWDINEAYSWCIFEDVRDWLTRSAFERLLNQCGWTVQMWNEEIRRRK